MVWWCVVWCGLVWCVCGLVFVVFVVCSVVCGLYVVVCVVQMTNDTACQSRRVREKQLIRVAEHLGASSRRPRHPFSALMAGEPLAVYLCTRPKKSPSRHTMSCNCGDLRSFLHVWTPCPVVTTTGMSHCPELHLCKHHLDGHVTAQIHLPLVVVCVVCMWCGVVWCASLLPPAWGSQEGWKLKSPRQGSERSVRLHCSLRESVQLGAAPITESSRCCVDFGGSATMVRRARDLVWPIIVFEAKELSTNRAVNRERVHWESCRTASSAEQ